ncbi:Hsp70 family protein [Humisphaera borealis]|uniref:Hsp70 family protein n=1 Tax=Humisphaera borealis TaxID=2807512 RepID=A0A7M2WUE5_9BACT|nr:Hsp70 family protein [Humisphaera borealis]QOV89069.1 Hsp70 family protein [Humisphaera borealis]
MAGRLAVDFGTSNTLVAVWDAEQGEALPLLLPDLSRNLAVHSPQGDFAEVPLVPSLIHYVDESQKWIGQQVFDQDLYEHPQTFRWSKRYISRRTPIKLHLGSHDITARIAGRDFLSSVLTAAVSGMEIDPQEEEVALTVPVEAYEHYNHWLLSAAEKAGVPHVRLVDEASAAAIGYGATMEIGDIYMIFDFGGGSMDVSVVQADEHEGSRFCRVLGKAGSDLGGATIDEWMFRDVLRRAKLKDAEPDVRKISRKLLVDIERAKELLSVEEKADISVIDMYTGYMVSSDYTRKRFEQMLDVQGLFSQIEQTLNRALEAARLRGVDDDQIKSVFMLGGSSLIPSVQRVLTRIFGGERVMIDRPLEAVACGAAAYIAGAVDIADYIQHDYAIRYLDPVKGAHGYRPIVRRGTQYPTVDPVAKVLVKATQDGQAKLGMSVFEVGEPTGGDAKVELIFDNTGAARVRQVSAEEAGKRTHYWINEKAATFLPTNPPAQPGEARFEVHFGVDANKRLTLSAMDVTTGRYVCQDVPVAKLS